MQDEWLASPWFMPVVIGAAIIGLGMLAAILWTAVYKHIICLRYLFGGWKAVVPFVSAMPAALGVFLLILVFAIMDGFVRETREMTRGTLSDIIVDAHMEGLPYYDDFIQRVKKIEGVEDATPTVQTYAIVRIKPYRKNYPAVEALVKPIVRACLLIGIRPAEKAEMGRFTKYLERQKGPGYPPANLLDVPAEYRSPGGRTRSGGIAGIGLAGMPQTESKSEPVNVGAGRRVLGWFLMAVFLVVTVFIWQAARRRPGHKGWMVATVIGGVVTVGLACAAVLVPVHEEKVFRKQVVDFPLLDYGDDVVVSTIPIRTSGAVETEAGGVPKVASRAFALVDTFKSGYWEADANHLYVDFKVAQQMAGMDGQPATDDRPAMPARASQVQVKVRDPAHAGTIVEKINDVWEAFRDEHPDMGFLTPTINTWETQQRMILTVVEIERNVTTLMLGMMFIGFGVLIALLSYVMAFIKSRDVGILKALGARDAGVGSLFLGYGFVIGVIGAAMGLVGALLMIHYLDAIEIWVNQTLDINVFPREMYYFEHIPRYVSTWWCVGVAGAVLILSTLASMAGGLLAAMKQPVETLRYE